MHIHWIPLLSIAVATISTPVMADDFFVSPQGSDRLGSGTSSDSPIQTIQFAVDKAQPGDTIYPSFVTLVN